MSEMIERVTKAISEAMDVTDNLDPTAAATYAKAAIAAMREPTREMYDALCATDKMWKELTSQTVWQTYINAALEDSS